MPHNFSHFIESIKRYLEKGALKSQQQQQQLSLFMDLAKINLRDQKWVCLDVIIFDIDSLSACNVPWSLSYF